MTRTPGFYWIRIKSDDRALPQVVAEWDGTYWRPAGYNALFDIAVNVLSERLEEPWTPLSERLAGLTGSDRECDRAVTAYLRPQPEGFREAYPPHYTSDLSAVVAEIERRKLWWSVERSCADDSPMRHLGVRSGGCFTGRVGADWGEAGGVTYGQTPCLALLRALVAAVEAEDARVPT